MAHPQRPTNRVNIHEGSTAGAKRGFQEAPVRAAPRPQNHEIARPEPNRERCCRTRNIRNRSAHSPKKNQVRRRGKNESGEILDRRTTDPWTGETHCARHTKKPEQIREKWNFFVQFSNRASEHDVVRTTKNKLARPYRAAVPSLSSSSSSNPVYYPSIDRKTYCRSYHSVE